MSVKRPHAAANAESEAEMEDDVAAPNLSSDGAPSSLSDPSTSLVSPDDWLRLCRHNHIHLPQTAHAAIRRKAFSQEEQG